MTSPYLVSRCTRASTVRADPFRAVKADEPDLDSRRFYDVPAVMIPGCSFGHRYATASAEWPLYPGFLLLPSTFERH